MAEKSTKGVVGRRVRELYELLLSNAPYADVLRYGTENWGVSPRMVDKYIQKANKQIIQEAVEISKDALEKHIAQRANLIHSALKDGDRRLAFEVMRDLTKLQGLYPSGKVEITTKDITDEQRIGRINTILDSARERRTGLVN